MPYVVRTDTDGNKDYYYTARRHKADDSKENQENKAKAAANATA